MRKILLSLSCLLAVTLSNAQSPLVPTTQWAKSMGGSSDDGEGSIAIDAAGNIYTVGSFEAAADFDPGAGTAILTPTGISYNAYISKLDASGNFVWVKQLSGTGGTYAFDIAVDGAGKIYVAGSYYGTTDFDPGAGTANLTSAAPSGNDDMFILQLDASGSYIAAWSIGSTGDESASSIAVDASGNMYTTGYFYGTVDFDPGVGTFNLTSAGGSDIFVSKLSNNGTLLWAKSMGSSSGDEANAVTLDALDNVYITGYFSGTALFDYARSVVLTSAGGADAFTCKITSAGNYAWVLPVGELLDDEGMSIAVDTSGHVYTTGYFQGTTNFNPYYGTANLTSAGGNDIYVLKLDTAGNYIWAKNMGGAAGEYLGSIAVDDSQNVYTTGYFMGTADFDPNSGTVNLTSPGSGTYDAFISKLDSAGNYAWAKNIGGTLDDLGGSIVVDAANTVYAAGFYQDVVNFNLGGGTLDLTSAGSTDIYICKISQAVFSVPTGILQESANTNGISVYPNPANSTFTVSVSKPVNEGTVELYNSLGTLVYKQKIANDLTTIEMPNQTSGLYFVKVISDGELLFTQELIKE